MGLERLLDEMPGWQFRGVGHQTECPHDPEDWRIPIKSGQWCEGCHRFVGRWITCACVKVWCKECWEKRNGLG